MEKRILRSLLGLALIIIGDTWFATVLITQSTGDIWVACIGFIAQLVGLILCISAWLQAPKE